MHLLLLLLLTCFVCWACTWLQNEWGWGIVVSVLRKPAPGGQQQQQANGSAEAAAADAVDDAASNYIIDTLLPVAAGSIKDGQPRPAPIGLAGGNKGSSSGGTPNNGSSNTAAAADGGKKGSNSKGNKAAADGQSKGEQQQQQQQQQQQPAAEMAVLPVSLTLVTSISVLRVGLPEDLRPFEARQSLLCVLQVSSTTQTNTAPGMHAAVECINQHT
jgi:hypothetical protein